MGKGNKDGGSVSFCVLRMFWQWRLCESPKCSWVIFHCTTRGGTSSTCRKHIRILRRRRYVKSVSRTLSNAAHVCWICFTNSDPLNITNSIKCGVGISCMCHSSTPSITNSKCHELYDIWRRIRCVEWSSCHTWMRHATYVNESWHTCEYVMSPVWMSHGTHVNTSCHPYERVMAHMWIRHVTRMNESWHTCEYVMSPVWMGHGTHVNTSCHPCEYVMSPMWMSHGTLVNTSCHPYEWVRDATHMNQSCHTHSCHTQDWMMHHLELMSHICMRHVTHMNESFLTHERVTPHIRVTPHTWSHAKHMSHVKRMNESCHTQDRMMNRLELMSNELAQEQARSDELLYSMLPPNAVDDLREGRRVRGQGS